MQIINQNTGLTNITRQNILEKANQAFSGGEKTEDFSLIFDSDLSIIIDFSSIISFSLRTNALCRVFSNSLTFPGQL